MNTPKKLSLRRVTLKHLKVRSNVKTGAGAAGGCTTYTKTLCPSGDSDPLTSSKDGACRI